MKESKIYFLNGKHIVSRNVLAELLNITIQACAVYEKTQSYSNPLLRVPEDEIAGKGLKGKIYYELLYALKWHRDNVSHINNPKKELSGVVGKVDMDNSYISDDEDIDFSNASQLLEIERAKNERIKRQKQEIELKVLKKDYIPSDDADKALKEIIVLVLSVLVNKRESLPSLLINKNIDDCKNIIESEFKDIVNRLKSMIYYDRNSNYRIYDFIMLAFKARDKVIDMVKKNDK
jgi:hypothetical protein